MILRLVVCRGTLVYTILEFLQCHEGQLVGHWDTRVEKEPLSLKVCMFPEKCLRNERRADFLMWTMLPCQQKYLDSNGNPRNSPSIIDSPM